MPTPSPLTPCPLWPPDLQDTRACLSCTLPVCLFDARGRPITERGAKARALPRDLPIMEVVRMTGISARQVQRIRKQATAITSTVATAT